MSFTSLVASALGAKPVRFGTLSRHGVPRFATGAFKRVLRPLSPEWAKCGNRNFREVSHGC